MRPRWADAGVAMPRCLMAKKWKAAARLEAAYESEEEIDVVGVGEGRGRSPAPAATAPGPSPRDPEPTLLYNGEPPSLILRVYITRWNRSTLSWILEIHAAVLGDECYIFPTYNYSYDTLRGSRGNFYYLLLSLFLSDWGSENSPRQKRVILPNLANNVEPSWATCQNSP